MLPFVKKALNAKQLWRKAAFSITALNRMSALANSHLDGGAQEFSNNVRRYKEESAKEVMEDASIMHHHNDDSLKKADDIPVDGSSGDTLSDKLAKASLDEDKKDQSN